MLGGGGGGVCYKKWRPLRIMLYVKYFARRGGAHKYYLTENVGFRRCIYVLGTALADVITFIEDTISYSDELTISLFQLKDLTELHKKQMILHGAATKDTKNVHTTRLKNQILENVPCLCETKKGKFTLLTLDSEMGRALFEACQSFSHDDEMIIAKTASVIRKQFLITMKFLMEICLGNGKCLLLLKSCISLYSFC